MASTKARARITVIERIEREIEFEWDHDRWGTLNAGNIENRMNGHDLMTWRRVGDEDISATQVTCLDVDDVEPIFDESDLNVELPTEPGLYWPRVQPTFKHYDQGPYMVRLDDDGDWSMADKFGWKVTGAFEHGGQTYLYHTDPDRYRKLIGLLTEEAFPLIPVNTPKEDDDDDER